MEAVGTEYSEIVPLAGSTRPILLPGDSVNQRAPSGPEVIVSGCPLLGGGWFVISPVDGSMRPIRPAGSPRARSVNQTLPSEPAATLVIAIHEIEDAEGFRRATDPTASFPDSVRLVCVYPLVNGAKAVCLWEGRSADDVGDFVEMVVGDANRAEFYEVDCASAFGRGVPPIEREP